MAVSAVKTDSRQAPVRIPIAPDVSVTAQYFVIIFYAFVCLSKYVPVN